MTSLSVPPASKKKDKSYFLLSLQTGSIKVCAGEREDTIDLLVQDLVFYYYLMYTGHQSLVLKLGSKCVSVLCYHPIVQFLKDVLSYNQVFANQGPRNELHDQGINSHLVCKRPTGREVGQLSGGFYSIGISKQASAFKQGWGIPTSTSKTRFPVLTLHKNYSKWTRV